MANWTMDQSPNYEAEQAGRVAVFNKIKPEVNWKTMIMAWIDESDFSECNQAAIWFTGGALEIVERKDGRVRVVGDGYYANIGA
jgi:hypothetical protein